MKKLINFTCIVILILSLGLTLLGGYWQLYPYKMEMIYDQNSLPILNTNHTIKGGETINWRAHFVIYRKARIEYRYILESSQTDCEYKILYEGSGESTIGEVDHTSAMVVVPVNFKPCVYHVRIDTFFHPNPSSRIIAITAVTENFTVTK